MSNAELLSTMSSDEQDYSNTLRRNYAENCMSERYSAPHWNRQRASSCHDYAEFLYFVDRQLELSAEALRENCIERNHGPSCEMLSSMFEAAKGVPRNKQKCAYYSYLACRENNASGCNQLGSMYKNGSGTEMNGDKAIKYMRKSCNLGSSAGCFNLSQLYLLGVESANIASDASKAFMYAVKACDLRLVGGCVNASVMLRKGEGVSKDVEKSGLYRDKANQFMKDGAKPL